MKKIYKYTLRADKQQDVMLPEGAEILTAQVQYGNMCLWALVDTNLPPVPRRIVVLATGEDAGLSFLRYIATVQMSGGALVFHVFERV